MNLQAFILFTNHSICRPHAPYGAICCNSCDIGKDIVYDSGRSPPINSRNKVRMNVFLKVFEPTLCCSWRKFQRVWEFSATMRHLNVDVSWLLLSATLRWACNLFFFCNQIQRTRRCDEEKKLADILRIDRFRVYRGNPRMQGLHVQVCHNIN